MNRTNVAVISIKFRIVQSEVMTLKQKLFFKEHLTQKHHFLFVYFDEHVCGIYFNKVWNCPECSEDSEKKLFLKNISFKNIICHLCILMNMNVAFISIQFGIVQSVVMTLKQKLFLTNI